MSFLIEKMKPLVVFFGAILITLILSNLKMDYMVYKVYDWLIVQNPTQKVSDQIAILEITDATLNKFDQIIPLTIHQRVLDKILSNKPKKIVISTDLNNTFPFHGHPKEIVAFMLRQPRSLVSFARNQIFSEKASEDAGIDSVYDKVPFSMLPVATDKYSYSKDDAHRRIIMDVSGQDLLLFQLAKQISKSKMTSSNYKGAWKQYDTHQIRTRYAKKGAFPTYTYEQILSGHPPMNGLSDKIVIVGRRSSFSSLDYVASPFATHMKNLNFLPLTEIHANDLNTLIHNNGVSFSSKTVNFLLIFISAAISLGLVFFARPIQGFIYWSGLIFLQIILVWILFVQGNYFLNIIPSTLAALIAYYLFLPARLVLDTKKYSREKITFAKQIGHDIKSPLSALNIISSLATNIPDAQKNLLKRSIHRIESIANTLLSIDNATVDFSNIDPVSLFEVIDSVLAEKEIEYGNLNIEWIWDREGSDRSILCNADDRELKRILSNLLNNAVESFNGYGRIVLSLQQTEQFNLVTIADNGSGMSEEFVRTIGTLGHSSKKNGNGLGLYSAKKYLGKLGGHLEVTSQEGEGTQITMALPR